MFDNDIFEKWLDSQAQAIVDKMGQGAQLRTEEMMILVLKAQSNHFHHLDKDLRNEMKTLRTDMRDEMKTLREDMDKRFEQVIRRMDRFMFWSLGVTVAAAAFVVTYLK
uniref:Uncharacterized protein n=1 Tax=Candidatus Kentrum sp. LPFa TaxID=2126335 RepID=A0A450W4P3_9GAMM|nr:MAG: hypothetical protein BECKLPF1236A_GA0070988_1006313 [Candidatus Kentron sp. LPFa]VFK28026.1 MAG: hypothetical protein BECKLPF1236C_GA0070990_1005613 [Candidatus Kentron sp. LPFa]